MLHSSIYLVSNIQHTLSCFWWHNFYSNTIFRNIIMQWIWRSSNLTTTYTHYIHHKIVLPVGQRSNKYTRPIKLVQHLLDLRTLGHNTGRMMSSGSAMVTSQPDHKGRGNGQNERTDPWLSRAILCDNGEGKQSNSCKGLWSSNLYGLFSGVSQHNPRRIKRYHRQTEIKVVKTLCKYMIVANLSTQPVST